MAREKNVKYEIKPLDGELPERPTRNSQLEDNLKVVAESHAKTWAMIAAYRAGSAATAAANTLRKRHGQPEAEGWEFKTRRVQVEGEERTGLFAYFDNERVVEGALDTHREHQSKLKAEKKARDAEKKGAGEHGDESTQKQEKVGKAKEKARTGSA